MRVGKRKIHGQFTHPELKCPFTEVPWSSSAGPADAYINGHPGAPGDFLTFSNAALHFLGQSGENEFAGSFGQILDVCV